MQENETNIPEPSYVFETINKDNNIIPDIIFIIPYRNREQHKVFFIRYMKNYILKNISQIWKIIFVQQGDTHAFNRGAMKNIGFLYVKNKYPEHYKNITLVFNDVDTVPYKEGLIDYTTQHGTVKHFYGFDYAFGGIFSITAGDFELLNGFPNIWGWGFEDNEIQLRWIDVYGEDNIDRSTFFPIYDMNILTFFNGSNKLVSFNQKNDYGNTYLLNRGKKSNVRYLDGINTIYDLSYIDISEDEDTIMLNVSNFNTNNKPDKYKYSIVDLAKTGTGFNYNSRRDNKNRAIMPMININKK